MDRGTRILLGSSALFLVACADAVAPAAAVVDEPSTAAASLNSGEELLVRPSSPYLAIGGMMEMKAAAKGGGRRYSNLETWSTNNDDVLKVSKRSSKIMGLSRGRAFVRLETPTAIDSVEIFVIPTTGPVLHVSTDTIRVGESVQIVSPEDYPIGFQSLNESVASVSETGKVTALSPGNVSIRGTSPIGGTTTLSLFSAAGSQPPVDSGTTNPPPTDTTSSPPPSDTSSTPPPPSDTSSAPPPPPPPPVDTSSPPPPPAGALEVALPQVYLDDLLASARAASAGRSIVASTSQEFKAALDTAKFGDHIVLSAGVTYVGPFTLRKKPGTGWITIRTNASESLLPQAGARMRPGYASRLPKIVSQYSTEPAIRTEAGANGYRLYAVEVTASASATSAGALVALGSSGTDQNTADKQPFNLVLDRVYIHGTPTLNFQRCIALNSAATAIVDSWISECHGKGFDSQAIAGWNGTGPYKIVNNFLEGAGENVMFGGADPKIPNALPSDIEFRRNHVYKPLSWKGVWSVKNSFELKIGRRVLVEGNIFENNWADAQVGFAIVLKSTNQSGTAPWSQTADVTVRYNVIRNSHFGMSMAGRPESHPAEVASRIRVAHNSFEVLSSNARVLQVSNIIGVAIENNAGMGGFNGLILHGSPSAQFSAINNVFGSSSNFVASADGKGIGTAALDGHAGPGWVFRRNVIIGAIQSAYPPDNFYPSTASLVGFLGLPALRLGPTSPYLSAGTDGNAVGPDYAKLDALTWGVVVNP